MSDKRNTDKRNTDKRNTDKRNTDKRNTDKRNTDKRNTDALPEEVFHVVTALFPELIRISAESDIKAVELFTIWYLKNNGKPDDTGQTVILRTEMTGVLAHEIGFSDGAIDQHLAR